MAMPGSDEGINGGVGAAQNGRGHVTFYVEVSDLESDFARSRSWEGAG